MTLAEIREWLRTVVDSPNWYIGKIDASKPECIGIYNATGPAPRIAIGGLSNTGYANKTVSILVHWGKNADKAEQKAQEVYNAMLGQSAIIGGKRVIMFQMKTDEPVGVGTDSEGYYEHVIEVNILHER